MLTGNLKAVELPLDAMKEPPLAMLRDYWREAAAGRPCLPSKELRPERFALALEHVAILERVAEPRSGHRIRLCGREMENKDIGFVRGAFLEDAQPPWYRNHLLSEVTGAIARAQPIHQRVEAILEGKTLAFTRVMFPLSSAGGDCDMLLVASVRPSNHVFSAIRGNFALA
jgi:hypothetical protein